MKANGKQTRPHREVIIERMGAEGYPQHEIDEALESWKITQSLIPSDYDQILQSDQCCFCADTPREAEAYANTVLSHREPLTLKPLLGFGKPRFASEVGSLLPVSIPICKRCMKEIKKARSIKTLFLLGFIAVGVAAILLIAPALLDRQKPILYISFLAFEVVGFIISQIIGNRYIKNNADKVHYFIFDMDLMKRMREKGWSLVQDNSYISTYAFKKDPSDFGTVFEK